MLPASLMPLFTSSTMVENDGGESRIEKLISMNESGEPVGEHPVEQGRQDLPLHLHVPLPLQAFRLKIIGQGGIFVVNC